MIRNRTMMGQSTGPREYGLVLANNTAYINTGVVPTINTRVFVDVMFDYASTATNQFLFGSRTSSGDFSTPFVLYNGRAWLYGDIEELSVKVGLNVYGKSGQAKDTFYRYGERGIIGLDSSYAYSFGGYFALGGRKVFGTSTRPIYLFTIMQGNAPHSYYSKYMTCYGCKIYDGTTLVRDLRAVPTGNTYYAATPAPSNCMVDALTGTYYEALGSGTFGIIKV